MADVICCDHHHQSEASVRVSCGENHPKRRRRMDTNNNNNIRSRFNFVTDHVAAESSSSSIFVSPPSVKRQKLDMIISSTTTTPLILLKSSCLDTTKASSSSEPVIEEENFDRCPKFGLTTVCGRRRDMEDAVAIHPSFWRKEDEDDNDDDSTRFHFFGVYDGHGCSHVAMSCKDRLHQLVKEELENDSNRDQEEEEEEESTSSSSVVVEWKDVMVRSFDRMDKEVLQKNISGIQSLSCRCELQMPQCDAVGSTAVVSIVTSDKVVVANCGDSRAILCRDGKAVPLSVDHKPDLPEELNRIEDAGGRVIYWDGPRVLGVLAMSRAIGDNYLKPYVSSVPEITVTERLEEDEFIIMASDGLWDVVANDTACGIVRMCLSGKSSIMPEKSSSSAKDRGKMFGEEKMDKSCSDAAMLLTKLALARRSADNVSVVVVDLRREKKKS